MNNIESYDQRDFSLDATGDLIAIGCPLCDGGNGAVILVKNDQWDEAWFTLGQALSFSTTVQSIGKNVRMVRNEALPPLNLNTDYVFFNSLH